VSEIDKIVEAFPHLKGNQLIADLGDQVDKAKDLRVMVESEGGKQVIKDLNAKVEELTSVLFNVYKTAEHSHLIGAIAALEAQTILHDQFTRAGKQEEARQGELDQAIREGG